MSKKRKNRKQTEKERLIKLYKAISRDMFLGVDVSTKKHKNKKKYDRKREKRKIRKEIEV